MTDFSKSLGFVILNPESNPTALRITTRTIADNYPEASTLCVIPKGAPEKVENQVHTKVVEGGNTITSLINAGIEAAKTEWCMVVFAGTFLRYSSLRKYKTFCTTDKDILYPVVDFKWAFDEASLNGLLMPRKAIKEVGKFGDANHDIPLIKLLWGLDAAAKGYQFKALVGARLI